MNPSCSSPGPDSNCSNSSGATNGAGLGSPGYATSPAFNAEYNSPSLNTLEYNNSPLAMGSSSYSASPGFTTSPGLITSSEFNTSPDPSYTSSEFSSSTFPISPPGPGLSSSGDNYFPPNISTSEFSTSGFSESPSLYSANNMGSSPPPNFIGDIPGASNIGFPLLLHQ